MKLNEEENTNLNFQTDFYTLNQLTNRSAIVAEMIYEEQYKERKLEKCEVLRTGSYSELLIILLIQDDQQPQLSKLKIYQMSLVPGNTFQMNSLRQIHVISKVQDFFSLNLTSLSYLDNTFPSGKVTDVHKKLLKKNDHSKQLQIFMANNSSLKDGFLVYLQNKTFSLYKGVYCIKTFQLSQLDPIWRTKEIQRIVSFKKNRAEIEFSDSQVAQIRLLPQIESPLVIAILNSLQIALEPRLYDKIFGDVYNNCTVILSPLILLQIGIKTKKIFQIFKMGIYGLLPCLRSIEKEVDLKHYKGKTVGIDAYCWLHQGAYGKAEDLMNGKRSHPLLQLGFKLG